MPTVVYNNTFPERAATLIGKYTMSRTATAATLRIAYDTFRRWMVEHEEFRNAVLEAEEERDYGRVVKSLVKRAEGYDWWQVKEVALLDDDGKQMKAEDGTPLWQSKQRTLMHMAPDTGAICFYLKNKRPEEWKDRVEMDGQDREFMIRLDSAACAVVEKNVTPKPGEIGPADEAQDEAEASSAA